MPHDCQQHIRRRLFGDAGALAAGSVEPAVEVLLSQRLYAVIRFVGNNGCTAACSAQLLQKLRHAFVGAGAVGAVLLIVSVEACKDLLLQLCRGVSRYRTLNQLADAIADKPAHFVCGALRQLVLCQSMVGSGS